jgi:hypothetical protein
LKDRAIEGLKDERWRKIPFLRKCRRIPSADGSRTAYKTPEEESPSLPPAGPAQPRPTGAKASFPLVLIFTSPTDYAHVT